MQLMAITSSTSIMYCTEGLFNMLTNEDKLESPNFDSPEVKELLDEYSDTIIKYPLYGGFIDSDDETYTKIEREFIRTLFRFYSGTSNDNFKGIDLDNLNRETAGEAIKEIFHKKVLAMLRGYFHPMAIIQEAMKIVQEMDALLCSDGVSR